MASEPQRKQVLANDKKDLDPKSIVTLKVVDRRNAGKTPGSRWGKIKFDDEGQATIKVPLEDVTQIHQFGWLSTEDQEKYLGLEEAQPASTAEVKMAADLEAARGAAMKLAMKNAELEMALESQEAKFKAQYGAYQEGIAKEIDALKKQMKDKEHEYTSELAALKSQLAKAKERP